MQWRSCSASRRVGSPPCPGLSLVLVSMHAQTQLPLAKLAGDNASSTAGFQILQAECIAVKVLRSHASWQNLQAECIAVKVLRSRASWQSWR